MHFASGFIKPFDYGSAFSEPMTALLWIIIREISDGGDKLDAIDRLRTRSVEVMFGQFSNHPVSPQQKSECFDESRLTSVIVSNKNRMFSKADKSQTYTTEVFYLEVGDSHFILT